MISPVDALLAVVLNAQLIATPPRVPLPRPAADVPRVTVHRNRVPAGRRIGTTQRISIDVLESAWRPEGPDDPEVPILAFAEAGQRPTVPGPLVRVAQGTEIVITLRNLCDSALVIGGLRPGQEQDTIQLALGATREVRYRAGTPGTFHYWGAFKGTTAPERLWKDSQLNGAFVVDPPGGATDDHILIMSEWFLDYGGARNPEIVQVINGKAWPHSETIELQQGDSVRFRVINMIAFYHPMHLHGFFYRIESRGDGARDVPIPPGEQALSNTDLIPVLGTMTFAFQASTPGNWLFHCHFAFHTDASVSLAPTPRAGDSHAMRGLVIALKVAPSREYVATSTANSREVPLYIGKRPDRLPTRATAYGFSLRSGTTAPDADSIQLPGPVLELQRGRPVRIMVHNQMDEPTSVHWHGLEIESYPDGVPHFSGLGDRIYTQIAPRDSFAAEFTPTRAGTYPYHSHLDDRHQMLSGLYGALLVLDGPRDTTRDHLIIAGGGGPSLNGFDESPFALVNGSRSPAPLRLAVGETHRLRLVSIHPDWFVSFTLQNDSTIARWRAVAKDGADLPPALATVRPARVEMGPGMTSDFEFTPTEPGEWRFEIRSVEPGWYIPLTVLVAPREREPTRSK